MEYIIVTDPTQKNHYLIENDHGFIEIFARYEDADDYGKKLIKEGECRDYAIYEKVPK